MKKMILAAAAVAVIALPGCGNADGISDKTAENSANTTAENSAEKNTNIEQTAKAQDAWLLYSNDAQGYSIPHLDSWYVKEFTVPVGIQFAITGFSREKITNDTPGAEGNGMIVMQVYNGPYMNELIKKQETFPGYSAGPAVYSGAHGSRIEVDGPTGGKQYMTVMEKNGKTFIFSSEELTDEEDVKVYNKMIEGFSLH